MYYRRKSSHFIVSCFLILIGFLIIFVFYSNIARDVIANNIKIASANNFIDIINLAVEDILSENNIDYNDLADINSDSNGNIVAVTCDTVKLMQIKSQLDGVVQEYIKKDPTIRFSVALGTFLGAKFLAGRGPKIPFEYSYDCVIKAEYKSEFYDAGINQTIHRIVLDVSADISTVIPWEHPDSTVNTSYIIAETIIVGKVPSSFTNFELEDLNKIINKENYDGSN